ncbi:nitrate- and nitrite sensing domain-containing protein [Streptomyces sp. ME19-01-6]|uniref:sensor histidine kinase n=1 Tax=Streptomyces sp. ME19-01-6 TaxID=3028686 RepID=UPI0029ADA194|nr:nitrate- and nitrite sensing domain-containing protein [Streptomyces sp. ME19-01-6]MDX3225580.1 nitrate- and nitrite sensing domain-containing protein [Streptomyces sp. ME19-01-6]
MRKKRLRGSNHEQGGEPRRQEALPQRSTARVRNRLAVSVAVVSLAVLGAGAPAVLSALDDTTDAQKLVDLAETNRGAVTLAHALADERDAMIEYVAAGRNSASGAGVSESQRARVDRQVKEVGPGTPAEVRRLLDALPKVRQQALTGDGSALDVYESYTETVQALGGLADTLARKLPAGADDGSAAALAPLGRATEEASATRGLLLGALSAGGSQPKLTSAAQRTNVREQSALSDFNQLAPASARDRFARTVNGTEVTAAERYIARLTDQPQLSDTDLFLNGERVESSLSARIDRMRGVESSLATAEIEHLEKLRDDEVTDLEVGIGILGACLLLAIGMSIQAARSMTRPLAALRLGARRVAADPLAEEPIAFKGRDDEFADAVRAVNQMHQAAVREHERAVKLEADRARLVDERRRLADERSELRRERDEVATRLDGLRARVHGSFVSLALRTLGLIERQLTIIEDMEEREQDPDRLQTLFQLDHLATGMRRYGENLLVIAGSENKAAHPGPVPLLDVLRASISEVERYDRVQIQALPQHAQVAGYAADSISHLIAELLENATTFSPPDTMVQISGWLLESGEVMLSVQDEGIGMTPERFVELNNRLSDPVPEYCQGPQPEDPLGLGLYVVTRLAARHGVRVQLREQKPGGVAAVVVLPTKILPAGPPGGGLPPAAPVGASYGGTSLPSFPGSVAEANSNTLPGQSRPALAGTTASGTSAADLESPRTLAHRRGGRLGLPRPGAENGSGGPARTAANPPGTPAGSASGSPVGSAAGDQAPERRPRIADSTAAAAPGVEMAPDPTPPRGHPAPAPSDGGTLPMLPRRAPKQAPDPLVEAAERTIQLSGHRDQSAPDPRRPAQRGGGETIGGHGIRPVGADAWGPAEGPAPAAPADATRSVTGSYLAEPAEHTRPGADAAAADEQLSTASDGRPAPGGSQTASSGVPGQRAPEKAEVRERRRTDKGLPKRTPKNVALPETDPLERTGAVNAEELRRRLGGFQKGARKGRRDAEAEFAGRDPAGERQRGQSGAQDEGGTVEEARR